MIKMVFDSAFSTARDDDDFFDAGGHGFFNQILDHRLVDDGQHFFGLSFGDRQESSSESGRGKNGFANFNHGIELIFDFDHTRANSFQLGNANGQNVVFAMSFDVARVYGRGQNNGT